MARNQKLFVDGNNQAEKCQVEEVNVSLMLHTCDTSQRVSGSKDAPLLFKNTLCMHTAKRGQLCADYPSIELKRG